MPTYEYIDENGHQREEHHRMLFTTAVICVQCGSVMWRKPTGGKFINWGGLPPSQEQRDPVIEKHLSQDFGKKQAENDKKYLEDRRDNQWHVNG